MIHDDVLGIYFVKHAETGEALEELATFVRSVGNIRQLFTIGPTIAVAVRDKAIKAAAAP